MTKTNTNRRDVLRLGTTAAAYAAGAVVVTGGVAAVSAAKGSAPVGRAAWDEAVARYYAAKRATDAHTATHINAAVPDALPIGPERSAAVDAIPKWVWDESDRLDDALARAQDALMATPSPHAAGFALKYRVAHGDGRQTDAWNAMLDAEARRFSGEA